MINGGALDPKALALKVQGLVRERNLNLRVAYLSGDDLYDSVGPNMPTTKEELQHLDSGNSSAAPAALTYAFLRGTADGKPIPMVSAHAYLGARGIVHGLRNGADIILCGRVADASPVIAAAWFWHDWAETDYDELAGALIAGHLIECSAYVTGGNFSGFDRYNLDDLIEPGFPIAEIDADGTCIITKHPGTKGMVTVDTVRCQFLYELQGTVYLNSDVNAYIGNVAVEEVEKDRYDLLLSFQDLTNLTVVHSIRVSGIKGTAPPPTTKLAVFYQGGYEAEILLNATGYATSKKWDLLEKQIRYFLPDSVQKELETLEFQRYVFLLYLAAPFRLQGQNKELISYILRCRIGTPSSNPKSQASSTTYLRIFIASRSPHAVGAVGLALRNISLKHFSGTLFSLSYLPCPIKP